MVLLAGCVSGGGRLFLLTTSICRLRVRLLLLLLEFGSGDSGLLLF